MSGQNNFLMQAEEAFLQDDSDNKVNNFGLSQDDIDFISKQDSEYYDKYISSSCKVEGKGKVVCLSDSKNETSVGFPRDKKEAVFFLAINLNDEDSLAFYEKLARERRVDFLENCYSVTNNAKVAGKIKTSLAKFFAGVVKNKSNQQKRIQDYKKRHSNYLVSNMQM